MLVLPAVPIRVGEQVEYLFPVFNWETGDQVALLRTSARPAEGTLRSTYHMAVADGRFYASTGDGRLWCFELPKSQLTTHTAD